MLGELLPLAEPLGAGRHHEARLAAGPQLGVDDRGHDVHVGDAAVRGPGLGAVEDPLVGRLVVRRPRAHRAHVAAGVGLGGAERAELEVARACRTSAGTHSPTCSSVPLARTPAAASDVPTIESPIPASPQNSSSMAIGKPSPVSSSGLGGDEVHRVEPDLGRLLDDRPRELLLLVPLGRRRPDHVRGERVHPAPQVEVVLVELEGGRGHGST